MSFRKTFDLLSPNCIQHTYSAVRDWLSLPLLSLFQPKLNVKAARPLFTTKGGIKLKFINEDSEKVETDPRYKGPSIILLEFEIVLLL